MNDSKYAIPRLTYDILDDDYLEMLKLYPHLDKELKNDRFTKVNITNSEKIELKRMIKGSMRPVPLAGNDLVHIKQMKSQYDLQQHINDRDLCRRTDRFIKH